MARVLKNDHSPLEAPSGTNTEAAKPTKSKKRSVWREPDPIQVVMDQTGKTRLQVLEGIRAAIIERHSKELARNPKAPRAMANLDAMIEHERGKSK
jgi:hypothetical protein